MTITNLETYAFEDAVNCWVLDAITAGVVAFDELVMSLPGVYPAVVLRSLRYLSTSGKISAELLQRLLSKAKQKPERWNRSGYQIPLPIPHPLDYDWRFTDATAQTLLRKCTAMTRYGDTIVLLGTPSLLRFGVKQFHHRRMVLLEANSIMTETLAQTRLNTQVMQCNLLRDPLPKLSAAAVVLDPPWYAEQIHSFLWAAYQLCKIGGHILVSLPPVGTRPGMKREWAETLSWAKRLGLHLVQLDELVLSYFTPLFEFNGLRAQGIPNLPKDWRRGNLAIFSRSHHSEVPRPIAPQQNEDWQEVLLLGVRIRVRNVVASEFENPSLISVVPGDVLTSVSRRDQRRSLADVWTSGNRIFACRGQSILWQILQAIAGARSPHEAVAATLKRSLSSEEATLVSHAVTQIVNLVSTEQKEHLLLGHYWNETELSVGAG
jgi:hypothetical protein